ncbi:MAG: hypothetical protein JWO06_1346 [Bacteroidota bacterium]|nr:hypothetical protein [Bacteroidota bacterium]
MKRGLPMFHLISFLLLVSSCMTASKKKDDVQIKDVARERLKQHAMTLKEYARQHKYSTELGILVDMTIASDKKRIFVVDMKTDSVLVSGLCAHGQCGDYMREDVVFSNQPGSNCSCNGHFKIGGKYSGDFGLAYKLYGLDSTNSNAFDRFIVFHYYSCVSDFENSGACRSNGCPMVSPQVFKDASKYVDASKKPVLMWIYK